MMTPFTQAIIPSKDDRTKASYLASLSEAFESRILQGAGDAHWRIPYGIFSSLFSKPRIDDGFSTAPESEFFDFYQFVNPINDDIWPPEGGVNEAAGINVQTNILNRFIFGMNYKEREGENDVPGAWIYEREDVRANKLQENMKSNNANGFTFPYFTQIGSTSAGGESYTAMGFANEVYSLGYLNSKNSRSGNYYGGYYGSLLGSLVDPKGCGEDTNGPKYPLTQVSFYKNKEVKTSNDNDTVSIKPKSYLICPQGGPEASNFNSVSSFSGYNIVYNNTGLLGRFANSQWHLDQSRTNIYLSREVDNHLLRVLYFYITHATGFDFDWFFNNQYAYAPELGSLNGLTLILESDVETFKEVKDIVLSNVRLNFTGSNFTSDELNGKDFLPLPSNGGTPINYQNVNNPVSIKGTIYPNLNTEEIFSVGDSDAAQLLFNLGITLDNSVFDLYEYNEDNKSLRVPPGFVFQRFKISKSSDGNSVTVKSFDLEIKITNNNTSDTYSLSYSISSGEDERVVLNDGRILNNDYNFKDGKSRADNYVSFKISNVQIEGEPTVQQKASLSITIIPIFLLEYKPKIEDAYALIRGCCYYGTDDAKFDSSNHPFNRIIDAKYFCSYLSDDLKKYGYIKSENISNPNPTHSNSNTEINTNGVFEAARRASLCVRIVRGDNLLSYDNSGTSASITFKAYALGSGASQKSSKSGTTTVSSAALIEKEKYVNSGNFEDVFDKEFKLPTEIWGGSYPYSKYYRIDKTLQSNLSVGELDEIKHATDINEVNEAQKNDTSIALKSFIFTALYDCVYITEKGKAYYLQFEDKNGKRYDNVKIYDLKNNNTMSEEGYDPDVGYVIGSDADQISQLWAFSREPNYSSLASSHIKTSGYFYVTDKGDFIYKEDDDLYNLNFQSSVPIEKPGQTYTTYPEYITGYNPKSNTKFDLKSKFYELYNYLYLDYSAANIYDISKADSSEKILAYKAGSFVGLTESDFDKNKYDKYLRGYSIKVYANGFIDSPNLATGIKPRVPKINFYYKNSGEDVEFSITINSEEVMTLTYFDYDDDFEFDISDPDNLLTQDNLITIQIINKADFSNAEFGLTPIHRDPQIFRSAVFDVIQDTSPKPRYIFQGIAGEEDDSNKNGIISEANSGNPFTNEWAMWINFLPYKNSISSPFEPDAYARVVSPFIDRCHVNSGPLIKSAENSHINLGLQRSFVPVSPPSYRYMPLKIKPAGLNFENITGEIIGEEDSAKNNFYKSCAANISPYKIKSAIFNNGSKSVTIKLDSSLNGAGVTSYRTDANGLFEWMDSSSRSFKTGDASLSNENGYNAFASGSGQANGYTGAFYPIFIFVKLIPKPILDGNDKYEQNDSRLIIEPLKQAEWYLDIMREGFTDGSDNISNLCSYSGYQTPPDYTYSSLLYKSNNNNVVTLSNYDLRNSGDDIPDSGGLASHNPRGFGAINYNGSYRDHYASIARGINSLTNFRVPYPADFTITYKTTEYQDIDTLDYSTSPCGIISNPWPSVALAPTSASYDLRDTDGSLMGANASWVQSYNTDRDVLGRSETSFKLVITPPKNLIKNAYDNIPLPSNPSPITANKQFFKKVSDLTDVEKEEVINNEIECGGSTKYFSYKIEPITNCVNVPGNLYIDPPIYDGGSSTRFYLEINGGYIKSLVSSSYFYEFFESGFAICSPGTQPYSGGS